MADDDDYQILPQKEFYSLKKKVDELSGEASPKKLMETMDELKKILNELIELFKATSQEIKQEEKDDIAISKKLDKISAQNKVIAEAILAVSEKIGMHEVQKEPIEGMNPPANQGMGQQAPMQQPPMPQMPSMQSQSQMPPPLPGMSPMPFGQQPFGSPSFNVGNSPQPESFTPRPYGGFGQPDTRQQQPFGQQPFGARQSAPFEPPEFAPQTGQMNMPPQSNSPFGLPGGPQPDFPDLESPFGDKDSKKKKGFFGFGK